MEENGQAFWGWELSRIFTSSRHFETTLILFIGILGLFGSNVLIWDLPIVVVPCLLWYVKLVKHDAPHDQQELNMLLKQIGPHLYLMATYLGVRLVIFATVLLLRIFKMLFITSIALVTTMCIALGTLTLFNKKWKHDHAGIVSLLRERLEALGYEQESTSVEIGLYIIAQIALILTTTQQVLWPSIPGAVQLLVSVASWPYTMYFLHLSSLKQILGSIFDKISAGSKTFEYRAIKLEKGIRLVTLHRRLPYLQVQIRLEEVSLDSAPPYEAISYTWGDPKRTKKIFVNGLPFYTTPSTFNVLRSRSSPWKTRVLWIDSICINQEDVAERSSQVLLMGEIYRCCSRAIVCLGGGLGSIIASIGAISLIHDLDSDSPWNISTMRVHEREKNVLEFLSLLRLPLLVNLLSHPWFWRVWVVQEVAHPKIVHVVYGGLYLDWSFFEKIAETFIKSDMTRLIQALPGGHEARAAVGNVHIMVTIRQSIQIGGMFQKIQKIQQMLRDPRMLNLLKFSKDGKEELKKEDAKMEENRRKLSSLRELLKQFADLKCSNDLDKVYALLGLTTDGSHNDFIPDYTKHPETLFVEVALYLLLMDHPFRVLCIAGIGHRRKYEDLPSWAPDWTTPPKGAEFDFANYRYPKGTYTASGESQAQIVCHREDKTLLVRSIYVDEIAFLGSPCSIRSSRGDFQVDLDLQLFDRSGLEMDIAWHTETLELATAHAMPPLKTRANLTESLWRTLAADIDISTRPAPLSLGDAYAGWVQLLEYTREFVLKEGRVPNDENFWAMVGIADRWGFAMGQGCSERKFCVTKGGYIGLVPPGSEVGDQIWVFLGAPTPYVLRRKAPVNVHEKPFGELTFALVGECYVDEMMDGEILEKDEKERRWEYVTLV